MKSVWLGCCLLIGAAVTTGCSRTPAVTPAGDLSGKRVLVIVAPRDFQDAEYAAVRAQLDAFRATVTVASSITAPVWAMSGASVVPDLTVAQAKAADYDAIVLVGGPGAKEYWDDSAAHALVTTAAAEGKVVGAICLAPVTLARAGLLRGRRATVWASEGEALKAAGAIYTGNPVEVDGKIITGNGPEAAPAFAIAVVSALGK